MERKHRVYSFHPHIMGNEQLLIGRFVNLLMQLDLLYAEMAISLYLGLEGHLTGLPDGVHDDGE
jgi:hypothetical protein